MAASSVPVEAMALTDFTTLFYSQCVVHGVQAPTEIEPVQLMHEFVIREFRWCTDADFKMAFSYNSSGKLKDRHEHYGSFSIHFVGAVLSDYKEVRNEAMKKWSDINMDVIEPEKQLPVFSGDGAEQFAELLRKDVEKAKQKDTRIAEMLGASLFDKLYTFGYANDDTWTMTEWSYFKSKATSILHDEQNIGATKLQRIKNNPRMYENYKTQLANEIKRQMYVDFIKTKYK